MMTHLKRAGSLMAGVKFACVWVLFLCASLLGCGTGGMSLSSIGGRSTATESAKLNELFEGFFEGELALFPTLATEIGDHRYDDQLEIAISEEHIAAQRRLFQHALKRAMEIKLAEIDSRDRLYLQVFTRNLKLALDGFAFKQHLMPVRQLASLAVEFPLLGSGAGAHPFRTVADYENFLRRIEGFETWIDTAIVNMRQGIELQIVQPTVVIERTLPQIQAMIVSDPKTSLFYQPIARTPDQFSDADRARLTRAYTDAIEMRIVPAYRRLLAFLQDEYLSRSRRTVAFSALPDGAAWYDYLVKTQTTTDLKTEEIFQLGMTEIARITKEMERVREQQGFTGSLSEFSRTLSENAPRGYQSRIDLVQGYEAIGRVVAPGLPRFFSRLPKARLEIRTIEEFRERSAPSQYWSAAPDGSRPGIFYVNASGVENNPRRASEPLYLHEAVPGHHFQISLQQERDDLPRFQRFADYTAFVEGWALYAESLGVELGLYKEPSQYFSRLNSELFRAARLVVDVGLHRKGWSREQAIKYLMDTTLSSESSAASEVDRYIAVPAQALGYKVGQLKIAATRSQAEAALGPKFDIRAFHDELLRDGALPLDILEAKMDAWIKRMGH
jgi:uncharacterized protein (DUF885 family)